MARLDLDRELAALPEMDLEALRRRWTALTGCAVPRVSAKLLRPALAFELQAAVHGGLSRRAQQRLEQIVTGKIRTRETKPGMRLVRAWNGMLHVVTIGEDGVIRWNERT